MKINSDLKLFELTKRHGSFAVWVKDQEGNILTGESFDLCLAFATGSTQVFPCSDKDGDFYQLHSDEIVDCGIL